MSKGKFGTAINCMDGRVQLPLINWMKNKYGLDYIDMITEPGPDKMLSQGRPDQVESIKSRVEISVNVHGSQVIIVAAHDDCAGDPVSRKDHTRQVRDCLKLVKSWGLPAKDITGVWINGGWEVETID